MMTEGSSLYITMRSVLGRGMRLSDKGNSTYMERGGGSAFRAGGRMARLKQGNKEGPDKRWGRQRDDGDL